MKARTDEYQSSLWHNWCPTQYNLALRLIDALFVRDDMGQHLYSTDWHVPHGSDSDGLSEPELRFNRSTPHFPDKSRKQATATFVASLPGSLGSSSNTNKSALVGLNLSGS